MQLVNQSVINGESLTRGDGTWWGLEGKFLDQAKIEFEEQLKQGGMRATTYLAVIHSLIGDVRGKTILDIGCGAKNSWEYDSCSEDSREKRAYDPWLCRALHKLGANCYGIDGGDSPGEEYNHITGNLLVDLTELLGTFPDNSIDLACAWSFFDSDWLRDSRELFEALVRRLEAKVKPKGFFVFEATGTGLVEKEAWEEYLRTRQAS